MQLVRLCTWVGTIVAAGVLIGIVASSLQRAGFSPLFAISLLLGVALGFAAIASFSVLGVENRRTLLLGAVLGSIALIVSEHYTLYQAYTADYEEALNEKPELALFREVPTGFVSYLRQESAGGRVWLWLLDGTIITATAIGIPIWMQPRSGTGKMD